MNDLSYIQYEENEGVGIITINSPKVNALTLPLLQELRDTVYHCKYDEKVRCVVLTAAGKFFCAGADLKLMMNAGGEIKVLIKKMAETLHDVISMLMRMEKPVITAINGYVAGGGYGLAIAGDLVIAAESAKFTMAYTASGLPPDGASTYLLPRLIGHRRAMELAITNRTLTAQEALNWHMITQVVPDDQLHFTALALAKKLAQGPTDAYAYVKKLLMMTDNNTLEEQTDFEKEGIAVQLSSYNGQEGIKSFIEKRKPEFQ